jgi:hypothetical protein
MTNRYKVELARPEPEREPAKYHPPRLLVNAEELGKSLRLGPRLIQKLTKERVIPHVRFGKFFRYYLPAVESEISRLSHESIEKRSSS